VIFDVRLGATGAGNKAALRSFFGRGHLDEFKKGMLPPQDLEY
jgi:hypothetical protein